jgi:hypothetical protein
MIVAKTSQTLIRTPPLTENQRRMIAHPARVLWIGCGTKTGKTTAAALWIADGILKGERCAWIGPWHQRTRSGYEAVKAFLSVPLQRGDATASESTCQIRAGAGRLDSYSGDNPESVFGEGYHRVVVDEASRMKETILPAVLTTISATKGMVRLAFNLERGRKNWAIANLCRVRAMSPEEREAAGEGFMTFPTLGEGFVDQALIEQMKGKMPDAIFRALYLAEIPDDDLALFRNLDEVFRGLELIAPAPGRSYTMGLDLARKADWTVATIIDDLGCVVACDRFTEVSWTLQVERAMALYRRFQCSRAHVDASGIGDVVIEELRKRGMNVEPFIFTKQSKKELIEGAVIACDSCSITIPDTPRFEVYRQELESFEYVLDGGEVRYGAPAGMHDDTVMSLALALRGMRREGAENDGVFLWYRQKAEERRREEIFDRLRRELRGSCGRALTREELDAAVDKEMQRETLAEWLDRVQK